MNYKMVLFMSLAAPALCFAKPAPYAVQCALLDRILETAQAQSSKAQVALKVLESVAVGRTDAISPESEIQVGLVRGELQRPEFTDPFVRAHALRAIGQTALPEAVDFLEKLKPDDLGRDDTQQVWPAAQIALREALLNRIPDLQGKIEFLENTVKDDGGAVPWAIEELCNRGILTSLPVIQESIRRGYSGERAEEEFQFCEARIRAVSSDPDRAKALGFVLSTERGPANQRLAYWAINQLASMRSPKADAELDRFAAEIGKLPEGSPQRQELSTFSQIIRELRAQRSR